MLTRAQRQVLFVIQLALTVSVVTLFIIAVALRGRFGAAFPDPEVLVYAFLAQALFAAVVLAVLRRLRQQPRHAARVVPLTIVGWAVGESAALVGSLVVLLGAPTWCALAGMALFVIATRLHPVPAAG